MAGGKESWKDFEKRRNEAQKTGYGQTSMIPRAQVVVSNPAQGYPLRTGQVGPASRNNGGYNIGFEQGPGDDPPPPFSYTHGSKPGQSSSQWNSPPHGGHETSTYFDGGKVTPTRPKPNMDVEEFEEGLVKRRKCRDVICLAIFFAFLCLMAGVAIFAIMTGNYKRLDPFNEPAGCESTLQEVSKHGFKPTMTDVISRLNSSAHSTPSHRADLPTTQKYNGFFDDIADDMKDNWPKIVFMCLIALGLSIIMTILLRLFANVIVWTVVFIFVAIAIGVTIAIWVYFVSVKNVENGTFWEENKKEVMLVCAILITIVAVLFLLVLLAMRRRIALVVRLFKEAGKAVHAIPVVLFQPVYTFIFTILASTVFISLAVLIETSRSENSDGECKRSSFANYSRYLNIFAYLWMLQFLIGCQHMIVAGAIAQWYFIRDKARLGFPVLNSFKNVVRYHLGSIALGSMIIAILKFIRFILNQIKKRLGGVNCCIKCLLCFCQCFFWCLDTFLQFINRNAYIEIAIYGYAFCPAAKRAFKVIINNSLSLAAINSIGDFVLFLGKFSIMTLTATCGYFMISGDLKETETMDIEWAIIFIGAYFSYYIANCFLSIYEMAMDTIFICFCEDIDKNDGMNRPYFMSRGLMEFMQQSKKLDKKKKNKKSD